MAIVQLSAGFPVSNALEIYLFLFLLSSPDSELVDDVILASRRPE